MAAIGSKHADYALAVTDGAGLACEDTATMSTLLRKIDWRIVPIMFLVYLMNLIDKVALNVSEKRGVTIIWADRSLVRCSDGAQQGSQPARRRILEHSDGILCSIFAHRNSHRRVKSSPDLEDGNVHAATLHADSK